LRYKIKPIYVDVADTISPSSFAMGLRVSSGTGKKVWVEVWVFAFLAG
jgi:hypothetical protein